MALPALFFGLGRRALWNPVEPRYAGICAEILEHHSWLVPTYNRHSYDQKPALFFWLGATALSLADEASSRLFLVRLPSALGGLLLVLGTWAIAHDLLDKKRALLAALLAMTCWISFWSSRFCHLDTLFAASFTWALYFARKAVVGAGGSERIRTILLLTLSLCIGLMLKGPGVFAFILATLVVFSLMERNVQTIRKSGILWAIPAAFMVAALWFVPAWINTGNDWAKSLFYDAGVMHLFDPTNKAKHGVTYYPTVLIVLLAPWSFFGPALFLSLWRRRREAFLGNVSAFKFVLAWCIGIIIVLYTGTTYRSRYLIPLVAPFAILMAEFLSHEFKPKRKRSRLSVIGTLMVVTLLCSLGLSFAFPQLMSSQLTNRSWADFFAAVAALSWAPKVCGAVIAGASLLASFFMFRSRFRTAFAAMVFSIVLAFCTWAYYGAPAIDACRGDAKLIAAIRSNLDDHTRLVAVQGYAKRESTEGYFFFELGRHLECVLEDAASLDCLRDGEPCLLLLRQRDLDRIGDEAFLGWQEVGAEGLGHHNIRIFRNSGKTVEGER